MAVEDTNGNLTHSTDQRTGTTHFEYDKLGRVTKAGSELFAFDLRTISFQRNLEDKTGFVRDGSHLLQEIHSDSRYTYLNSYELLVQVCGGQPKKEKADNEPTNSTRPHRLPKEMTDKDSNTFILIRDYYGWGRLKEETKVTDSAYQTFRLQNKYADREAGLHDNFFRYYEPDAGRFVSQDPIGLIGGGNLYLYALNVHGWIDSLGWKTWVKYKEKSEMF